MCGQSIEVTGTFEYLGIILGNAGSWRNQNASTKTKDNEV
jgi:hypothetical protein